MVKSLRFLVPKQRDAGARHLLARSKQSHLIGRQLRIVRNRLRRISALTRLQVRDAHALIDVLEAVHAAADGHALNLGLDHLLDVDPAGHADDVGGEIIDDGMRAAF